MKAALDQPFVLFVDDDEANLKVLSVHLDRDFPVLTAQNGPDALSQLEDRGSEIGLVVADQRMAGMTGAELLAVVNERFPDVGRMLITAYADLEPVIAAINSGQIMGYIRKPWNPVDIRMLLRSALDRVQLRRSLRSAELLMIRNQQQAMLALLSAGVGHEIRGPLSVLMLNTAEIKRLLGVLRQESDPDSSKLVDETATLTDECSFCVDMLRKITDDLRVLAAAPDTESPKDPINVNGAIARALRFIGTQLTSVATLELATEEIPIAAGSESGFTQVMANLLTNALHAFDDQPRHSNKVIVRSFVEDDWVVVEVEDNGSGVPEDVLPHVFEPFYTTKRGAKGLGVGLALCKQIVDSWGGTISIVSRPNEGATARVTLPIDHRVAKKSARSVAPSARPSTIQLLVIDDDSTVLGAVERCLRKRYRVDTASSGRDAIALLQSRHYEAVVCDLHMPETNGVDVFDYMLREAPSLARKTAFITGGPTSGAIEQFIETARTRGNTVLFKPFSNEELVAAVERILDEPVG